jgi:hypothetical protein
LVTEKKIGNKTVFLCDICGLGYSKKYITKDCEDYCKAHPGSCSVEITKKAVYFPDITHDNALFLYGTRALTNKGKDIYSGTPLNNR